MAVQDSGRRTDDGDIIWEAKPSPTAPPVVKSTTWSTQDGIRTTTKEFEGGGGSTLTESEGVRTLTRSSAPTIAERRVSSIQTSQAVAVQTTEQSPVTPYIQEQFDKGFMLDTRRLTEGLDYFKLPQDGTNWLLPENQPYAQNIKPIVRNRDIGEVELTTAEGYKYDVHDEEFKQDLFNNTEAAGSKGLFDNLFNAAGQGIETGFKWGIPVLIGGAILLLAMNKR